MHESGSSFFLELSWRHPAVDDGAATRYGINRSERFLLWGYGRDVMFFLFVGIQNWIILFKIYNFAYVFLLNVLFAHAFLKIHVFNKKNIIVHIYFVMDMLLHMYMFKLDKLNS